ncbi:MAG: type II toxin-antitoxin system RelE/ParE family toxin [Giesbergeria sp.]|uniref:type II toxin-antitoxin system RelE family toxin n=1 Tax=Giesbergeria sp. TaxID=2818473 RepID=UPI0026269450|nr:type II toxin-antitoxin system RelE/ParE family toxin [Giesbergeria sp.]MDD2609900.1 type II toxin-antitoxin system RelE/ParE family toxin [Giesbergeria sp.]
MRFDLRFKAAALDEWQRLDATIRTQFKNKLAERLDNPRIPAAKLSGHPDRYKIKLRSVGYRLVYEVRDAEVVVVVIAVGKRERNQVYALAAKR